MKENPITKFLHENYSYRGGNTGFAKDAGVSYQTVHKAQMGLYPRIPKKLLAAMVRDSDLNAREWDEEYSLWVQSELDILVSDISSGKLEAEALFVPGYNLSKQYKDFTEWRQALSYSQIDFCKTFLIQQTILQKYEAGDMQNFPISLKERMTYVVKKVLDISEELAAAYVIQVANLPIRKK